MTCETAEIIIKNDDCYMGLVENFMRLLHISTIQDPAQERAVREVIVGAMAASFVSGFNHAKRVQ